ncbi:MAG: protease inhibitor I42 family protein [Candidatus Acidiferrales bacterium]
MPKSRANSQGSESRCKNVAHGIFLACVLLCGSSILFAQQTAKPSRPANTRITDASVWSPSPDALAAIRTKCGDAGDPSRLENCFLGEMKSAGASAEAVAFSRSAADIGVIYMRAFRKVGPVDVAYIQYVFRANELDGVFLVNGDPSPIDVDDEDILPKARLQGNSSYGQLAGQYPNVSIWPGDRSDTKLPAQVDTGWGTQTFSVDYILRDGCHACATIGTATVAFVFDTDGKFQGAKVTAVKASDRTSESSGAGGFGTAGVEEIRAVAGKEFSIKLPANHTTGYSWRLTTKLDPATLTLVSNTYNESTSGMVGASGEEVWTFSAPTKGTTQLVFEYVRPFEKNTPPIKIANFSVVIE